MSGKGDGRGLAGRAAPKTGSPPSGAVASPGGLLSPRKAGRKLKSKRKKNAPPSPSAPPSSPGGSGIDAGATAKAQADRETASAPKEDSPPKPEAVASNPKKRAVAEVEGATKRKRPGRAATVEAPVPPPQETEGLRCQNEPSGTSALLPLLIETMGVPAADDDEKESDSDFNFGVATLEMADMDQSGNLDHLDRPDSSPPQPISSKADEGPTVISDRFGEESDSDSGWDCEVVPLDSLCPSVLSKEKRVPIDWTDLLHGREKLSPYALLVLRNIEVFLAKQSDIAGSGQTNASAESLIAFRCVHCKGGKRAYANVLPENIGSIANNIKALVRHHFSQCEEAPAKLHNQLTYERRREQRQGDRFIKLPQYCKMAAEALGMKDSDKDCNGILPRCAIPSSLLLPGLESHTRCGESFAGAGISSSSFYLPGTEADDRDASTNRMLGTGNQTRANEIPEGGQAPLLSDLSLFILRNTEVFIASEGNIVGLRCVHCRHLKPSQRAPYATVLPQRMESIHSALDNIESHHFAKCREIPFALRHEMERSQHNSHTKESLGLSSYCVAAAEVLGLKDSDTGDGVCMSSAVSGGDFPPSFFSPAILKHIAAGGSMDTFSSTGTEWALSDRTTSLVSESSSGASKGKGNVTLPLTCGDRNDDDIAQDVLAYFDTETSPLVLPDDRMSTTDFLYLLFRQLDVWYLRGSAKDFDLVRQRGVAMQGGYSGIICRHCRRKRWYFDEVEVFLKVFVNKVHKHLKKCEHCPYAVLKALHWLGKQKVAQRRSRLGRHGSFRAFLLRVWVRVTSLSQGDHGLGSCRTTPLLPLPHSPAVASLDRLNEASVQSTSKDEDGNDCSALDDDVKGGGDKQGNGNITQANVEEDRQDSVGKNRLDSLVSRVLVDSNKKSQLVFAKDRALTTEFHFFAMKQVSICRAKEADRLLSKKPNMDLGYPGLICVHCKEMKWFFDNEEDMAKNCIKQILDHKCDNFPTDARETLKALQNNNHSGKKESTNEFLQRIWMRLMRDSSREKEKRATEALRPLFDESDEEGCGYYSGSSSTDSSNGSSVSSMSTDGEGGGAFWSRKSASRGDDEDPNRSSTHPGDSLAGSGDGNDKSLLNSGDAGGTFSVAAGISHGNIQQCLSTTTALGRKLGSPQECNIVNRAWLSRIESSNGMCGKKPYAPQVGDSVVYIPRAHYDTLKEFPLAVTKSSMPWEAWPANQAWPVVRCTVCDIRFRFPHKEYHGRLMDVVAILTLELTGTPEVSLDRKFPWPKPSFIAIKEKSESFTFEVSVLNSRHAEFIVPEHLYMWRITSLESAIRKNGCVGLELFAYFTPVEDEEGAGSEDPVLCPYLCTVTEDDIVGEEKDPHLQRSGFNAFMVKWSANGDQDAISTWEVSVANQLSDISSPRCLLKGERAEILRVIAKIEEDPNVQKWFSCPIETGQYTDYLNIIEVPMNLQLIRKRLQNNYYTNRLSVAADVKLLRDNWLKYSGSHSEMGQKAQNLYDSFKKLLGEEPTYHG